MRTRAAAAGLFAFFAVAQLVIADDLTGVWRAKQRFGPDARGALVIEHAAGGWSADFIGQRVPVMEKAGRLTFELPDDQGRFTGSVDGSEIRGHWITSRSAVNGSRYAMPVTLTRIAERRWRGIVAPRDDEFTLVLTITTSMSAFLRNPERNAGIQYNIERVVRDGNRIALVGRWNGRGDEKELASGTYNAEDGVISLWIRGATYDFTRVAKPLPSPRYSYKQPLQRNDGWPTGTLDDTLIDRRAIEAFVQSITDTPDDSVHAPVVDGILIARHGKLVLEEYFHGNHRDRFHETRSAAKVVTSTLAGAVIHAGYDLDLQSPLYRVIGGAKFAEGLDARKRTVTLEHLLTMRGGFFCDDSNPAAPGNESTILDDQTDPDYYHYSLNVPMATDPGGKPVYCSMMPNLALAMTGAATHQVPIELFDRLVARPMSISTYAWPLDPAGNAYGGGGVQFLPRDFMKFGQLLLDGGTWHGRRILDREFVRRASAPLYDFNGIQYGYLWWNIEYPYKERTVRAFFASGNGGQTVMAIPALDLVVAIFAANYADRAPAVHIQQELVPDYILPAVRQRGDDPGAPVAVRDFHSPYGRK